MKKVIIWGLKNTRNSLRFIHKGFYENFVKLGYETYWVDDKPNNQEINSGVFFVSNVASQHIKFEKNSIYILHNMNLTKSESDRLADNNIKYLNLQVYTKDSKGVKIDNANTLFSQSTNTLFQPWGTPLLPNEWFDYVPKNRSRLEWWIGAVWNNSLNQGNVDTIRKYRKLLLKYNTILIRRGGSRLRINGISDFNNSRLIRNSRFGCTIVGEWQRRSSYIPCRLFKNLSFGIPPISNMNPPESFTNKLGFMSDIEQLLDFAIFEDEKNRKDRFNLAREEMKMFTYGKNIERILKVIETGI